VARPDLATPVGTPVARGHLDGGVETPIGFVGTDAALGVAAPASPVGNLRDPEDRAAAKAIIEKHAAELLQRIARESSSALFLSCSAAAGVGMTGLNKQLQLKLKVSSNVQFLETEPGVFSDLSDQLQVGGLDQNQVRDLLSGTDLLGSTWYRELIIPVCFVGHGHRC
jgi:hypothetical protein